MISSDNMFSMFLRYLGNECGYTANCTTDDPNKECINGTCVCADGYSDTFNTGNCTMGKSCTTISSLM